MKSVATAQLWELIGIRKPLVLASSSPRRAALLTAVGCPFEVIPPEISEGEYGSWDDGELLRFRAVEKAKAVKRQQPQRAVLAADTVVLLGKRVYGKPVNRLEAAEMLRKLSGRTHEVWSAMCYVPENSESEKIILSRTSVTFRSLTETEISAYIATGEPFDKAGAYGIQGIGGLWVQAIAGCYFNVVGLPLSQLWDLLKP